MTVERLDERQWILKWLLLPFVLSIYWLSPDLQAQGASVHLWAACYFAYLIVLEVIARVNAQFYSKPSLQMLRIQGMILFGTTLLLFTGGAESRFWFVYLWSLFSVAFHFNRRIVAGILIEIGVLYFLASIIASRSLAGLDIASLLTSSAILVLLTVVFRYLVETVDQYRSLENRVKFADILQQIHQEIDTALDLQEVLDKVLERAVSLVKASEGSLMLVEGNELHFRARVGRPQGSAHRHTLKVGEGIAGKVAETGEPYLCHHTQFDKNFVPVRGGASILSIASVPIFSHDTVLGVINVDSDRPYRFFASDIQLLSTMADQVASAIERAELWESFRQVGEKALGGTEDLYQEIVDTVSHLTHCPVAIWQIDRTNRAFARIRAHHNLRSDYVRERRLKLEGSLVAQAMQSKQAIQIQDIETSDRVSPESRKEAQEQGWQSLLVVPLMAGSERAVGTLSVYSLAKRTFAPWQVNLVRTFASQAGIAIQNSERLHTIQRLDEIGQSLTILQESPEVLRETLERIAETAMRVLGADLVDLYQYVAEQETFVVPPIQVGERLRPDLVPKEIHTDDVVFKIISADQNFYVSDSQQHSILAGERQGLGENRQPERFVLREKIASTAAIIIRTGQDVMGVLFASYRQRHDFVQQPELREQIETLANFAGVAIQNARLLQQEQTLRERAEILSEVSSTISSALDLQRVAHTIVDELRKVIEYKTASIQLFEGGSRRMLAGAGFDESALSEFLLRPISRDALIRRIIETKETVVLGNVAQDSDWEVNEDTRNVKSWIGVPLIYANEVIGLLTLDHNETGFYDTSVKELLIPFAAHAAIAINNARMAQKLQFLHTIGARINISLDLKDILTTLVQGAMQLTHTESGIVYVLDETTQNITQRFSYPVGFEHPTPRVSQDGYTRLIVESKQQQVVEDAQVDPRVNPDIKKQNIRSFVGTPLISQGRKVVGVFYLNDESVRQFIQEDLALLGALADQAAFAIERARLFEQLERQKEERIAAIREIGFGITAGTGLSEILDDLLKRTMQLMRPASCGEIWLLDREGAKLQVHAIQGQINPNAAQELALGEGIVGWVAKTRRPYLTENVAQDRHFVSRLAETQSGLAVPLFRGTEVIGVLNIEHPRESAFTDEDIPLLEAIAAQVVIAVENARLFSELDEQAEQLARLQEVSAAIAAQSSDLDQVLELVVSNLGRVFKNAQACDLRLYDIQTDSFGPRITTHPGHPDYLPREGGSAYYVITTQEPRYIENTQVTPMDGGPPLHGGLVQEGSRAMAYLPLRSDHQAIGVLYVSLPEPHRFTETEKQTLELFAAQASVAIKNAQMFQSLEEHAQRLERLQKVSQLISERQSDLETSLQAIVGHIDEIFEQASCEIRLYNADEDTFTSRFAAGALEEQVSYSPRPDGTSHYVINQVPPKPFYAPDTSVKIPGSNLPAIREQIRERGIQAVATLPLLGERGVVGVLYVNWKEPHYFSQDDMQTLELFAGQATAIIQSVQNQQSRFDLVANLNIALGEHNLDSTLNLVYSEASKVMDLRNAVFYAALYDPKRMNPVRFGLMVETDDGERIDEVRWGKRGNEEAEEWMPRPRRDPPGLTEYVIDSKEPLLLQEHFEEQVTELGINVWPTIGIKNRPTKSWLGVPMMAGDQVVGVISVQSLEQEQAFDQRQQAMLIAVANQAAVTILNTWILDELKQTVNELEALTRIGQTLSSLGTDETLDLIYLEAYKVMDLRNAVFYAAFYDPEQVNSVRFGLMVETDDGERIDEVRWGKRGAEEVEAWMPRPRRDPPGLTEYVIDSKKPLLLQEHFEEQARQLGINVWPTIGIKNRPTKSWLGIPMMVGDQVVGVISAQSLEQERAFDQRQEELLASIANQAAVVTENAQLYHHLDERVKARTQQLTSLQRIGVQISSMQELSDVLSAVAENANAIFAADFSTLFPYRANQCQFEQGIRKGSIDVVPSKPSDKGLAAYIAKTQQPIFAPDADQQPMAKPTFLQDKEVRSFAGLPLIFRDETVGVLFVNFLTHRSFSDEEKEIANLLANQTAVAIANARFINEMEHLVAEQTQKLRDAQEKLMAAEVNEKLGLLTAEVAHHSKNLAGITRSCARRLWEELPSLTPRQKEDLEYILGNSEAILDLADDLFKPFQEEEFVLIAPETLVINAARLTAKPDRVDILNSLSPRLPQVRVQARKVTTYLVEILNNATRHSSIRMNQEKIDKMSIEIAGNLKQDGFVEIDITNHGFPIPVEQRESLFKLFSARGSRAYGEQRSYGLGLWGAKTTMEAQGGDIFLVKSDQSETTFAICLPVDGTEEDQK